MAAVEITNILPKETGQHQAVWCILNRLEQEGFSLPPNHILEVLQMPDPQSQQCLSELGLPDLPVVCCRDGQQPSVPDSVRLRRDSGDDGYRIIINDGQEEDKPFPYKITVDSQSGVWITGKDILRFNKHSVTLPSRYLLGKVEGEPGIPVIILYQGIYPKGSDGSNAAKRCSMVAVVQMPSSWRHQLVESKQIGFPDNVESVVTPEPVIVSPAVPSRRAAEGDYPYNKLIHNALLLFFDRIPPELNPQQLSETEIAFVIGDKVCVLDKDPQASVWAGLGVVLKELEGSPVCPLLRICRSSGRDKVKLELYALEDGKLVRLVWGEPPNPKKYSKEPANLPAGVTADDLERHLFPQAEQVSKEVDFLTAAQRFLMGLIENKIVLPVAKKTTAKEQPASAPQSENQETDQSCSLDQLLIKRLVEERLIGEGERLEPNRFGVVAANYYGGYTRNNLERFGWCRPCLPLALVNLDCPLPSLEPTFVNVSDVSENQPVYMNIDVKNIFSALGQRYLWLEVNLDTSRRLYLTKSRLTQGYVSVKMVGGLPLGQDSEGRVNIPLLVQKNDILYVLDFSLGANQLVEILPSFGLQTKQ